MLIKIQKILIALLHFLLLWWMYWLLTETGKLPVLSVLLHFLAMAIYGSVLIMGTAFWAKRT